MFDLTRAAAAKSKTLLPKPPVQRAVQPSNVHLERGFQQLISTPTSQKRELSRHHDTPPTRQKRSSQVQHRPEPRSSSEDSRTTQRTSHRSNSRDKDSHKDVEKPAKDKAKSRKDKPKVTSPALDLLNGDLGLRPVETLVADVSSSPFLQKALSAPSVEGFLTEPVEQTSVLSELQLGDSALQARSQDSLSTRADILRKLGIDSSQASAELQLFKGKLGSRGLASYFDSSDSHALQMAASTDQQEANSSHQTHDPLNQQMTPLAATDATGTAKTPQHLTSAGLIDPRAALSAGQKDGTSTATAIMPPKSSFQLNGQQAWQPGNTAFEAQGSGQALSQSSGNQQAHPLHTLMSSAHLGQLSEPSAAQAGNLMVDQAQMSLAQTTQALPSNRLSLSEQFSSSAPLDSSGLPRDLSGVNISQLEVNPHPAARSLESYDAPDAFMQAQKQQALTQMLSRQHPGLGEGAAEPTNPLKSELTAHPHGPNAMLTQSATTQTVMRDMNPNNPSSNATFDGTRLTQHLSVPGHQSNVSADGQASQMQSSSLNATSQILQTPTHANATLHANPTTNAMQAQLAAMNTPQNLQQGSQGTRSLSGEDGSSKGLTNQSTAAHRFDGASVDRLATGSPAGVSQGFHQGSDQQQASSDGQDHSEAFRREDRQPWSASARREQGGSAQSSSGNTTFAQDWLNPIGTTNSGTQRSAEGPHSPSAQLHQGSMTPLAQKALSLAQQGGGRAQLQFGMTDFGQLNIALDVQGDQVRLKVTTGGQSERDQFMQDVSKLKESLSAAGLTLAQVDVETRSDTSSQQRFADQEHQDQGGRGENQSHLQQRQNQQQARGEASTDWLASEQGQDSHEQSSHRGASSTAKTKTKAHRSAQQLTGLNGLNGLNGLTASRESDSQHQGQIQVAV